MKTCEEMFSQSLLLIPLIIVSSLGSEEKNLNPRNPNEGVVFDTTKSDDYIKLMTLKDRLELVERVLNVMLSLALCKVF